ncbi:MAG: hypothetical protein EBZ45_06445 [Actinobacteria bacterium]|nr:hypothetical protein [Actinomycetota bacterium]
MPKRSQVAISAERAKVLDVLKDGGRAMGYTEIADAFALATDRTIAYAALRKRLRVVKLHTWHVGCQ